MKEPWMLCIESWPLSADIPFTLQEGRANHNWTHTRFSVDADILIGSSATLKLRLASTAGVLLQAEAEGVAHLGGWLFNFHIPEMSSQMDEFDRSAVRAFVVKNDEIRSRLVNSPDGLSYMPVLRHYINKPCVNNILEWGPGRSTLMLAESLPDTEIFAIEHDPRWHQRILTIAERFPLVHPMHEPLVLQPAKSGKYVTVPFYIERKFDLIFIDGRLRADCIAIARQVVKDDGVVLVHDAQRKWYHQAFRFYDALKIVNNTAVLSP